MKKKSNYVGIYGVLLGLVLNRILVRMYGDSGRIIIISMILPIFITIWFIITLKNYIHGLIASLIAIPFIVAMIGVILDIWIMVISGALLAVVGGIIIYKIALKSIEKQKDNIK